MGSLVVKLVMNLPAMLETSVHPWIGKIPWRREWLPTPVIWPGEFHWLYSPWGHKKLDTTERLSLSLSSLWYHAVFVFLCPTYFTEHNAFQVYPCCCKWQKFHVQVDWMKNRACGDKFGHEISSHVISTQKLLIQKPCIIGWTKGHHAQFKKKKEKKNLHGCFLFYSCLTNRKSMGFRARSVWEQLLVPLFIKCIIWD